MSRKKTDIDNEKVTISAGGESVTTTIEGLGRVADAMLGQASKKTEKALPKCRVQQGLFDVEGAKTLDLVATLECSETAHIPESFDGRYLVVGMSDDAAEYAILPLEDEAECPGAAKALAYRVPFEAIGEVTEWETARFPERLRGIWQAWRDGDRRAMLTGEALERESKRLGELTERSREADAKAELAKEAAKLAKDHAAQLLTDVREAARVVTRGSYWSAES